MSQGNTKSSSNKNDYQFYKRQKRHEKMKNKHQKFTKKKQENIPNKKRGETNDPGALAKIHQQQMSMSLNNKLKDRQKHIYKSIEQKILEKAKGCKETFDIL